MNDILRRFAIVLPLSLAVAGCMNDSQLPATSSVTIGASPYVRGDLGTLTYRAVDLILAAAPDVKADTPIIVASISDAQHVETSSAFGNIVSDMIRTRLVQDGHAASEIRLRREMSFNNGEGEFLLSRNRRALMPPSNAAAIVTGTYAASYEKLYVSIKLVSATDAHIIAGADFVVPLQDVGGLLGQHTTELPPVPGTRTAS
jgi:TolB-like protein